MISKHSNRYFALGLYIFAFVASAQLVQRGPFSKPVQVFDDTGQLTVPLLVASDGDVEMYTPELIAKTGENLRSPHQGDSVERGFRDGPGPQSHRA